MLLQVIQHLSLYHQVFRQIVVLMLVQRLELLLVLVQLMAQEQLSFMKVVMLDAK